MEIRQAISPRLNRLFVNRVLAAMNVAPIAELIDTPLVHLWDDVAFDPNPDTVLADFTAVEAAFTDYAAQALTLEAPVSTGANSMGVAGDVTFHVEDPGAITAGTAHGWWIEDATGLVAFEKFEAGQEVAFVANGDTLLLVPIIPLPLIAEGLIDL